MTHPDEGTLQGYLDEELTTQERAALAEHLLRCDACRATVDELRAAQRIFSVAIQRIDREPDVERARDAVRKAPRRFSGRSLLRAAGLVLLLTAAASAAVPGSPVRWLIARMMDAAQEPARDPSVAPQAPAPVPISPAGVTVRPVADEIDIVVTGLVRTAIELVQGTSGSVTVTARGGEKDPVFRTSSGRIEVRDGRGGALRIELPAGLAGARITVDDLLYAEKVGGELRILVPADSVDGALVWK